MNNPTNGQEVAMTLPPTQLMALRDMLNAVLATI